MTLVLALESHRHKNILCEIYGFIRFVVISTEMFCIGDFRFICYKLMVVFLCGFSGAKEHLNINALTCACKQLHPVYTYIRDNKHLVYMVDLNVVSYFVYLFGFKWCQHLRGTSKIIQFDWQRSNTFSF